MKTLYASPILLTTFFVMPFVACVDRMPSCEVQHVAKGGGYSATPIAPRSGAISAGTARLPATRVADLAKPSMPNEAARDTVSRQGSAGRQTLIGMSSYPKSLHDPTRPDSTPARLSVDKSSTGQSRCTKTTTGLGPKRARDDKNHAGPKSPKFSMSGSVNSGGPLCGSDPMYGVLPVSVYDPI